MKNGEVNGDGWNDRHFFGNRINMVIFLHATWCLNFIFQYFMIYVNVN